MPSELHALASALVAIDSRSFVSNVPLAERIERELAGFEIERLDYLDDNLVPKRALVAHRGGTNSQKGGGIAFSGHMDTVPDTGWSEDPWSGRIADGFLHGLGSTDMKGPVAACIVAARSLPADMPVTLLLTTDEETTKAGARIIAARSDLARRAKPVAIIVAEPTRLRPVRGHRAHIAFTAVATGIQAHSSTGKGRNANWDLVEFLAEMKAVHLRLRTDTTLHDADYDPPFSDFNLTIDNHGAAVNVTVPRSTVRIKFRYSAKLDPSPVLDAVRGAAARAGLALAEAREGFPPELPASHPLIALCAAQTNQAPLTAPYGTDASELQALAPCVIMGPGDIGEAHTPQEKLRITDLEEAVPLFRRMAEIVAARGIG